MAARLNTLRKDAGDTIHDMRLRAGLECACAVCCGRAVAASVLPQELESSVFADPELGSAVNEENVCPF
jgi:hypothetical protein